ncbi:MAG: DUF5668 domain-containing protein [Candidatus Komeilibacteria bacterium]|nr:DUF5668 domain-containing protein [Candidatus Komeilibacteria bacterium]
MIFPWVIIILGVIFLLQNLNILPPGFWSYFWPIILIAIGLSMLSKRSGGWCGWCSDKDTRKDPIDIKN